jgi:hypothetical protein
MVNVSQRGIDIYFYDGRESINILLPLDDIEAFQGELEEAKQSLVEWIARKTKA